MIYPLGASPGSIVYEYSSSMMGYIPAGGDQMTLVIDESGVGAGDWITYTLMPGTFPTLQDVEGQNIETHIAWFTLADGRQWQHWIYGPVNHNPTPHPLTQEEMEGGNPVECGEHKDVCGGAAHADVKPPYEYANVGCHSWNNTNECLEDNFIDNSGCYQNTTPREWTHFADNYYDECLSHDYWMFVDAPYIDVSYHTNIPYDDHCTRGSRDYRFPNTIVHEAKNEPMQGCCENWGDWYEGETENIKHTWPDIGPEYHYEWNDEYSSSSEMWFDEENNEWIEIIRTYHYTNGCYDCHINVPGYEYEETIFIPYDKDDPDPLYPPHFCQAYPPPNVSIPPGAQSGDNLYTFNNLIHSEVGPVWAYSPPNVTMWAFIEPGIPLTCSSWGGGTWYAGENPPNTPPSYEPHDPDDHAEFSTSWNQMVERPNLIYGGNYGGYDHWYMYASTTPGGEYQWLTFSYYTGDTRDEIVIYEPEEQDPGFTNTAHVNVTTQVFDIEAFYNIIHYYNEAYCGDYANWPDKVGEEWTQPFTNFCNHQDLGEPGGTEV